MLLISRNEAYAVRELVTVAPVTTRIRRIPVEVPVGREEGLRRKSVVNLDVINTIPKSSLEVRLSSLSPEKLADVHDAIRFALGLEG